MSSDIVLHQLLVYVGTQAEVNDARQQGLIGENDFVIVTDAPEYLTTSDIVSSVSSSSTNSKAVGAKLFYDTCGDIETLINAL